jgi:hypothetical protein
MKVFPKIDWLTNVVCIGPRPQLWQIQLQLHQGYLEDAAQSQAGSIESDMM